MSNLDQPSGTDPASPMQVWIKRVVQHIEQKWDTDLTIIFSIVTGILDLLRVIDVQVTIGSILVIFSLIAVSIVRNRRTDESLERTIDNVQSKVPVMEDIVRKIPGVEATIGAIEKHMPSIDAVAKHLPTVKEVADQLSDITAVAEQLPHITAVLEKFEMHSRQSDAETALLTYVIKHATGENKIRKATIMRYSIHPELVARLLENGAEVTIFMQDEATAEKIGSQYQAKCITTAYDWLKARLPHPLDFYPLTIYKYTPPCSMAGINFDDELIYMGWYTYEYSDELNRVRVDCANDTVQLYGHDKASLIVQKGYEGFSVLDMTFKSIVDNYKRNAACIQSPGTGGHALITLVK